MHHVVVVRVGDGLRDARERVHEAAERPAPLGLAEAVGPGRRVDLDDDLAEGPAADLLHREPEAAVPELAPVVDGDDARVLEAGGDLRLDEEPRPHLGRRGILEAQDLHREGPVEDAIAHAPDLAERPAADELELRVALRERGVRGWRRPAVGRAGVGELYRRLDWIVAHEEPLPRAPLQT